MLKGYFVCEMIWWKGQFYTFIPPLWRYNSVVIVNRSCDRLVPSDPSPGTGLFVSDLAVE